MKNVNKYMLLSCLYLSLSYSLLAQVGQGPTLITTAEYMREAPSLKSRIKDGSFTSPVPRKKEVNPRRGIPSEVYNLNALPIGGDPLISINRSATRSQARTPLLTFDALSNGNATPTDPTGAVGPDHYVSAYNSGFRVYDRNGDPLTPNASLATIWPGESLGDPIVLYDRYADRWLITQFSRSPNGVLLAYSQGPDPVNDGWYTYRFNTGTFPDYPKFSIWSDGIYMTANKDQSTPTTSEVVYVFERDDMIAGAGQANVQALGFPLPGIVNNGFYSPLPFHADGANGLPPVGTPNFVAYMQDDVWSGVSSDHVKLWELNIDWATLGNSTISATPTQIAVTPFDGLFDNGSFSNLPQPSGPDIDALQATMMYMMPYYRFGTHNSVLVNWVVDLDGNDDYAGIRWVELRQSSDGQPWTIHQEGTHTLNDNISRFCGSLAMDHQGNIGLAYTVVSPTTFPSLRYTGRLANDPLGQMTVAEHEYATGTSIDPSFRYGDYGQMVLDPTDDQTFWHIGEYFDGGRNNGVVAFRVLDECAPDLVITEDVPTGGTDTQRASNTLTAGNTIAADASAIYSAGTSVVLSTGFHALQNSYFRGHIEGCDAGAALASAAPEAIVTPEDTGTWDATEALAASKEEVISQGLEVFPNPTRDRVTVRLGDLQGATALWLFDLLGNPLIRRELEGKTTQQVEMDLSRLPAGIYLLRVMAQGETVTKKVVKR